MKYFDKKVVILNNKGIEPSNSKDAKEKKSVDDWKSRKFYRKKNLPQKYQEIGWCFLKRYGYVMKVISRNANVLGDLKKSRDLKDAILHHKLDIIFIQEIKKIKIHQLGWK